MKQNAGPERSLGKWPIIAHIPHSSMAIPEDDQTGFLRSKEKLVHEVKKLNDHFTDKIFNSSLDEVTSLIFPVNRFLVDVERFEKDDAEPMAAQGMGVLYTHDTEGRRFREDLSSNAREKLVSKYYRPHHQKLEKLVKQAIEKNGSVMIIDGHSFPAQALPCDQSQAPNRPDICLGTDDFHTPSWLVEMVKDHFEAQGFSVSINHPYSGTMVPLVRYQKDRRVSSIMIEINRHLYLGSDFELRESGFRKVKDCVERLYSRIQKKAARNPPDFVPELKQ
ncbi:N-formylglutamate amidohydrolase [Halomonas aquatica]|uniref:N-formylglutamate amidohydrolase n=1 Tax=Halomonas aquatica TaxID=3151123 RepID=A0ABV1NI87_9GAMM